MKKILFFCLLGALNGGFAQTQLDSLKLRLSQFEESDTSRLFLLEKICDTQNTIQNRDSLAKYADQLLRDAQAQNQTKYIGYGKLYTARVEFLTGNSKRSIELLEEAIVLFQQAGYRFGEGRALSNLGLIQGIQGKVVEGIRLNQDALKIFEELGNRRGLAGISANLAQLYMLIGLLEKAIYYADYSLKNASMVDQKFTLGYALHLMADVNLALKNYEKAKFFHEKALKTFQENNDQNGVVNILIHSASQDRQTGDYLSARDKLKQGIAYFTKTGSAYKVASSQMGLIRVYIDMKEATLAQRQLDSCVMQNGNFNAGDYPTGILEIHYLQGQIHQLNGDFAASAKSCMQALEVATEIGNISRQSEACDCLFKAYKSLGNTAKALEYHEQFLLLKDSLKTEELAKKLQQKEFQKQLLADSIAQAEKARLVEAAYQEEVRKEARNRNMALGAGFLVLLLAGGLWSRLRYIRKSRAEISLERDRSENLLLNILPAEIAEELKANGEAAARDFDQVSILFTDFKEFTQASEKMSATELVSEINHCFKAFDEICERYQIEKIKTIGDAYMAAGGLPLPSDDSVEQTVLAALEMQAYITKRKAERDAAGKPAFEMRVGIHTGPVVAGIVGVKKFQYDIWGDTVNTASRMESHGEVGKVNISQNTYELLKDDPLFSFESRGMIEAKGKGEVNMWFVSIA